MTDSSAPDPVSVLDLLPTVEHGERFDELLRCDGVVIERIVSSATPDDVVYVQAQAEWVLLVQGRATLAMADGADPAGEAAALPHQIDLGPGQALFIPPRVPHRVVRTSAATPCVWLAVHVYPR